MLYSNVASPSITIIKGFLKHSTTIIKGKSIDASQHSMVLPAYEDKKKKIQSTVFLHENHEKWNYKSM